MRYTRIAPDLTSRTILVPIYRDNGLANTSLAHNSPGLAIRYQRDNGPLTTIPLASPNASYASGGFVHVGSGVYRLDLPNVALASGATTVTVLVDEATDIRGVPVSIDLDAATSTRYARGEYVPADVQAVYGEDAYGLYLATQDYASNGRLNDPAGVATLLARASEARLARLDVPGPLATASGVQAMIDALLAEIEGSVGFTAADRTKIEASANVLADTATDASLARRADLNRLSAGIVPIATSYGVPADHFVDVVVHTRAAGGVRVAAALAGTLRDASGDTLANTVTVASQADAGVYGVRVDTTGLAAAAGYTLRLTATIAGADHEANVAIAIQ